MARGLNFGAGPAMLPLEVLKQAQEELLEWNDTGMSVFEVNHRGPEFGALLEETENLLRESLSIPSNYRILFLTSPGRAEFSIIPMNLLRGRDRADYLITGIWSEMAEIEASKYCKTQIVASSKSQQFLTVPEVSTWNVDPEAAYFYYTANETIAGVELHEVPEVAVPLVSDMTSSLLSRPLDLTRFGLIFASVQKNIAPAGMTLVIVRDDLLGHCMPITPSVYDYAKQAEQHSLYYTPTLFSCYMANLTLKWLQKEGGLAAMGLRNQEKAARLYALIDKSAFYQNKVEKRYRSWMNVTFSLSTSGASDLEKRFLLEAHNHGLQGLAGHRVAGGMRASLYNAMPLSGVLTLIEFMEDFERRYG